MRDAHIYIWGAHTPWGSCCSDKKLKKIGKEIEEEIEKRKGLWGEPVFLTHIEPRGVYVHIHRAPRGLYVEVLRTYSSSGKK
jgi:hypothetical protein